MRTTTLLDLLSALLLAQCVVYFTMNYGSNIHDSTNSPQPWGPFQPGHWLPIIHFVPMLELLCHECRNLHFFLLNLMKFPLSQSSTFWWFLWTKALPFCVSITPPHLTQSANLLTVPSASSYRPLPSCLCYAWKWISRRCSFSVTEVTVTIILFPGFSFLPLWKTGVSALSLFPVFMDFCRPPWFFTYDREQVTLPVSHESPQALWIWIHPVLVVPTSLLLPYWLSSITNSAGINLWCKRDIGDPILQCLSLCCTPPFFSRPTSPLNFCN